MKNFCSCLFYDSVAVFVRLVLSLNFFAIRVEVREASYDDKRAVCLDDALLLPALTVAVLIAG